MSEVCFICERPATAKVCIKDSHKLSNGMLQVARYAHVCAKHEAAAVTEPVKGHKHRAERKKPMPGQMRLGDA